MWTGGGLRTERLCPELGEVDVARTAGQFEVGVRKAAKAAPVADITEALGNLVLKRQHSKAVVRINAKLGGLAIPKGMMLSEAVQKLGGSPPTKQRRSPRRIKFRMYEATSKTDISRSGTFRRYMLATIRKHSNTASAAREHELCDVPEFAKNKLDFNWAADNGFINWLD